MDYRNYSDKKRMKGIYRFVKRVYRNVIERNHRRSLLESYGKEMLLIMAHPNPRTVE